MRDYAAGQREVPPALAKFLRYLVAAGVSPGDVDAALARPPPKRRRG